MDSTASRVALGDILQECVAVRRRGHVGDGRGVIVDLIYDQLRATENGT